MEYIFDRNNRIVHTSVREICEFLYRTGDVYSGGTDIAGNAMLEGAKIHRKLQAEYKKNNKEYQSEFHINYSEEIEDFTYEFAGSIDGILEKGDATVIDEFKTTRLHLEDLQWDTVKAYSAQIMCYGYIYAHNNSLNFVTLRLTYYNCDSDDIKTIEKEYTFTELRTWFEKMLCEHLKWAKLVYNHKIKRDESLKELAFPFGNFRQGQRTLSGEV